MTNKKFFLLSVVFTFQLYSCTENSAISPTSPVAEYTQIDFEPAWSDSGDKVVYIHSDIDNDFTGIYRIDSDGKNKKLILNSFANSPDWSPDGNRIVFSLNNNIYKINVNGDSLKYITDTGINSNPKWSSDGDWIAFSGCENSLCKILIMKSDGSQKTIIDTNAVYPNWVNGSSSLIYFKPILNNNGIQTGDTLCQYFFSNGSKQVISVLNNDQHKKNSYPEYIGDALIFCSMNKDGFVYIYRMNLDGSNIIKLTTSQSYTPDFSILNQKIIYTNRNKGEGRLWQMDKNGNGQMQFTF